MSLIICADDFGLTRGISKAIIKLAERHRISAVSCMVEGVAFREFAEPLKSLSDTVEIGLHLTLTDQKTSFDFPMIAPNGSFVTFGSLFKMCLGQKIIFNEIFHSIERQLKLFQETFGFLPTFVDGHQHVQNFPVVREAILKNLRGLGGQSIPYIRTTRENWALIFKRNVSVAKTCQLNIISKHLLAICRNENVPTNDGFTGVYQFSSNKNYQNLVPRFVLGVRKNTILMCHPGFVDDELKMIDMLTYERETEYRYLNSSRFLDLLDEHNIKIGKYQKNQC